MYKPKIMNAAVVVCCLGLAFVGLSDLAGQGENGMMFRTWRLPILAVLAAVLVTRAIRRGVVATDVYIEGRRLLSTWRVPWRVVESYSFEDPSLVPGRLRITLIDGSERRALVGSRRRDQPRFLDEIAKSTRTQAIPSTVRRPYADPNHALTAFIAIGALVLIVIGVVETDESNRRIADGVVDYRAPNTVLSSPPVITLTFVFACVGLVALLWTGRQRGKPPSGPWPAKLKFPDDGIATAARLGHHPIDMFYDFVVRSSGIFSNDGRLIVAISSRPTPDRMHMVFTYWYAPDFVACTTVSNTVSAWSSFCTLTIPDGEPRVGWYTARKVPPVFYAADAVVATMREVYRSDRTYLISNVRAEPLAEIRRSHGEWTCRLLASDLPLRLRQLILTVPRWAEATYQANRND